MDEGSRSREIAQYSFLRLFADDDRITDEEVDFVCDLALEDRTVDDREREVLRNIFDRIAEADAEPDAWADIQTFRTKYGI